MASHLLGILLPPQGFLGNERSIFLRPIAQIRAVSVVLTVSRCSVEMKHLVSQLCCSLLLRIAHLECEALQSLGEAGIELISCARFRDQCKRRNGTGHVSAGDFDPIRVTGLILEGSGGCGSIASSGQAPRLAECPLGLPGDSRSREHGRCGPSREDWRQSCLSMGRKDVGEVEKVRVTLAWGSSDVKAVPRLARLNPVIEERRPVVTDLAIVAIVKQLFTIDS